MVSVLVGNTDYFNITYMYNICLFGFTVTELEFTGFKSDRVHSNVVVTDSNQL